MTNVFLFAQASGVYRWPGPPCSLQRSRHQPGVTMIRPQTARFHTASAPVSSAGLEQYTSFPSGSPCGHLVLSSAMISSSAKV